MIPMATADQLLGPTPTRMTQHAPTGGPNKQRSPDTLNAGKNGGLSGGKQTMQGHACSTSHSCTRLSAAPPPPPPTHTKQHALIRGRADKDHVCPMPDSFQIVNGLIDNAYFRSSLCIVRKSGDVHSTNCNRICSTHLRSVGCNTSQCPQMYVAASEALALQMHRWGRGRGQTFFRTCSRSASDSRCTS